MKNLSKMKISDALPLLQSICRCEKIGNLKILRNLQMAVACLRYRQAYVCKELQEIIGNNCECGNLLN